MNVFDDLLNELEAGKKHFDEIYAKHAMECGEKMSGCCSWNIDWFSEPMPLESGNGNDFEKEVRNWISESVGRDATNTPKAESLPEEHVLVFGDQAGFCHRIFEKVPENRIASKKIMNKPANLLTEDDMVSIIGARVWDMVVVGFPLDPPASNSVEDIIAHQSDVARGVFQILKTCFLKEGTVLRLAVLTHDIFSEQSEAHKERGLSITTNGTLFGLCNTARLELELPLQFIDIEDIESYEVHPHIASELFRLNTFGVNTVRHCYPYPIRNGIEKRASGRYVMRQLRTSDYEQAKVEFKIPEEGVVAISGGNGALGIVMGNWLLDWTARQKASSNDKYNPTFSIQFLSRSAKIQDVNLANWAKVVEKAAALNIEVSQSKVDMSTRSAVDKFVAELTPNLVGFIHSAGILKDSMIPNQTWEKFTDVYAAKHWAALYLHEALERYSNPNLKFFWMFSSTSVYGSMGQINYSSSNSYMDALARHRVATGRPACAIQWGAWGEVGMAATMEEAQRRRIMMGPVPYFSIKQGLEGLEGGLRTGLPGFSVFIVNPPMYYGMIQSDATPMARYGRNFTSQWVPTPAPTTFDGDQVYNLYRMYRYIMAPYESTEPLVWNEYIRPKLCDKEDNTNLSEFGYGFA